MEFPQLATRIKTDNSTAYGIINDTIKQNRSKTMNMRIYWLKCREAQEQFDIYWGKGATNLADYLQSIIVQPITKQYVQSTCLMSSNDYPPKGVLKFWRTAPPVGNGCD